MSGTSPISGQAITTAREITASAAVTTLLELIHRLTMGSTSQALPTNDSVGTGGAQNMKEFIFFFNRSDAPNSGVVIFI